MENSWVKWIKIVTVIMLFQCLGGCGGFVKFLDTSWYTGQEGDTGKELPPLEIPPELAGTNTPATH